MTLSDPNGSPGPPFIIGRRDPIKARDGGCPDRAFRPGGCRRLVSPRGGDHVDIRIIGGVAGNAGSDLEDLCVAIRAVLEAMTVRVPGREPGGISRAKHLFTSVGDEHDLAGEDIDELVAAGVPMTLARPRPRRQPA